MADTPAGTGIKKEVLGQPLWLWGLGAAIVLGGYWYFTHKSSSSGTSSSGTGSGAGKDTSTSDINESIKDWQNPPTPAPGGGGGGKGPERKWLIHKTGSKHPWTYLAHHHERIEVGPHGSRKIVRDK